MKILQKGDLIWSGHRRDGPVPHYLVLDDDGTAFNIVTRGHHLYDDNDSRLDFDNRNKLPYWVHKVMRGEQDITEQVREQIEGPEFEVSDRVTHKGDPTGEVGVVVGKEGTDYTVVFNGSSKYGPFVEHHAGVNLLPA